MEDYTASHQFSQNPNSQGIDEVVSVKDWLITLLILAIPIVGIVMLFVWGFGNGTNANKRNFAKASLIWAAIIFVLYLLLAIFFLSAFLSALQGSRY